MKKLSLVAYIGLVFFISIFLCSCSLEIACPLTITYKGQTYNTVLIGSQCWMKENLNYATGNSWCYDNNSSGCDVFGRLYDWATVMNGESSSNSVPSGVQGICPDGWHVPSDEEWKILEGTVDSQYPVGDSLWDYSFWRGHDAGKNLKSTYSWYEKSTYGLLKEGNGADLYGFAALPGSAFYADEGFGTLGTIGSWWSSTESSSLEAWYRTLNASSDDVRRYHTYKTFGFSLRCVKD